MKTGIELIERERHEQIYKHGFTLEKDDKYYKNGELVQAALHCLERVGYNVGFVNTKHKWPKGWSRHFEDKIAFKDDIGKLKVAGAFYMAENHRLGKAKHSKQITRIAEMINDLILRK